jgi:hypothetical protein
VDRRGATFLAGLRLDTTVLGAGANIGLRVSLLPLPPSRYLIGPGDLRAPSLVQMRSLPIPYPPAPNLEAGEVPSDVATRPL